ncbi:NAD(P)H-dependent glycerol-3-phosphate dehydrogenase [Alkaliphilus oremlandii]|uniref:Glycerol-3-phosphate dehydrogenase [NAD(P)+] n=1 Tax=Alkaliphilus oremlandii (strain OhILAs) TaxID=350688 RepID=A8MH58_ALKOO|nr:NAD(P)H-dependent glycerol-3-phosphate dehydrogenase [Alkaliphilus oremlandii]ABW18945.1 Glycerol-3-phosphate dehydrogenase (NAD(P)(+)) [Alkaliphilus oremlandii OhILAs]
MEHSKIAVLGAGSWGTALSIVLCSKGHHVNLWMRNEEQYKEMTNTGRSQKYLPGIDLPKNLNMYLDLEKAMVDSDAILISVSSQAVRGILKKIKPYLKGHEVIINAAKGLEKETHLRISEVVAEELPENPFVVLSGPSHAEEVSNNMPTTVVVASKSKEIAEFVQDLFITSTFRVYTNPDVIGVELGGSLKNVIAFGAGIVDGLGYGDNAKAALITRGISEIARLGNVMGADISTFAGLSGIGDLIVTCTSMHSRNRRAGILIGQGHTLEETLKEIGMVVEGIATTKVAYELAQKYGIEMPITQEIYDVIYNGGSAKNAVHNLMTRNRTHEIEEVVSNSNLKW